MDNADRCAHTDPLFYDYKILKLSDHVKNGKHTLSTQILQS